LIFKFRLVILAILPAAIHLASTIVEAGIGIVATLVVVSGVIIVDSGIQTTTIATINRVPKCIYQITDNRI
jgi:hypothetical protein